MITETNATTDLIDITRPLGDATRVWPGDKPLEIHRDRHQGLVVSWFSSTCHLGTHVDAPLHLDPERGGADSIALHRLVGPAEVVPVREGSATIDRAALPAGWRPRAPRLLLRTGTHPLDAPYDDHFPGLAIELIQWLAAEGVHLVGVDTPSVDRFTSTELEAHYALLQHGITWIEGLWLDPAPPGPYELIALPLPLVGTDAAPLRAVLRREPGRRANAGCESSSAG